LIDPAAGYLQTAFASHSNRRLMMGTGVSLILAAAGASSIWAVDVSVVGVDPTTVGVILLVVGCVGAVLSLVFWSSWGGFGGRTGTRMTTLLPMVTRLPGRGRSTASSALLQK
jgi:hypothetical protein